MKLNLHNINLVLKGFGMGAANVVPGVSGGTIALLTGIYGELIDSLNAIIDPSSFKLLFSGKFRAYWKYIHGTFLLFLLIGILLSIFSLAKLMEYVIVYHPVQTWAFFFGLIIASSVLMMAGIKGWKGKDVALAVAGAVLGFVISTLSPTETPSDLWFIFVCGAVAICTMILPGISGSFILVVMGKYNYIMQALNDLNLPVLIVFALGCVVGILAFSKFLHWLLKHFERGTMIVLLGFVIGSLIKVWPWFDMNAVAQAHLLQSGMSVEAAAEGVKALVESGVPLSANVDMHIFGAIIWCIGGIALVWALEMLGKKKKEA